MSTLHYMIGSTSLCTGMRYAVNFMSACEREPIRYPEVRSSCGRLYKRVLVPSNITREQVGPLPLNPRAIPMYAWKIAPYCRTVFDPRLERMRREEDIERAVRNNGITPHLLKGVMDYKLVTEHIAEDILEVSRRVYANDPSYNRKYHTLMVVGYILVGIGVFVAMSQCNSSGAVFVGGGLCLLGALLIVPRRRYVAKLRAASKGDQDS